jgi:predicted anti-sigma-YlaC factor YlaD
MCLDPEILSAYLDGEVMPRWRGKVEEHLSACERCRKRLEGFAETRRILVSEGEDWRAPLERVRRRLLAQSTRRPFVIPIWKRSVSVPFPIVAGIAALLLLLACSLTVSLVRSNVGLVRITKVPSGGTEIQISAPIANLGSLLKSVDSQESPQDVFVIPNTYPLMPVGQPYMGKEADYTRQRP